MQKISNKTQSLIKAQLCPRQKWIADKDVECCFKCDKKFHSLYRRKHHCRSCGQIFCSICSNYFFNGKEISDNEKQIRMCDVCYMKCWKYVAKHDEDFVEEFRKSNEDEKLPSSLSAKKSKSASFTEQHKLKQIQLIVEEYSTNAIDRIRELQSQADEKFSILLQVILKQNHIPLQHLHQVNKAAHQIVSSMPLKAMITNNLNINENVKYKYFIGEEFCVKVEPKILIKKNFLSKRVKDVYEGVKCILVYGGMEACDIVLNQTIKQATFEVIVNNRLKEMSKLLSYCSRMNIGLIFVEGEVDKECEDKFYTGGINIIPKVKVQHLVKIRNALGIEKIVQHISRLYEYTKEQIVGDIKQMKSQNYISSKQNQPYKKYFSIESLKQQYGMLTTVTGPNALILQKLSKEMKRIVQLLRHIKLKVYKVKLDQDLLDSMSQQIRNECYLYNSQMFFTFYNQFHSDILNYLKEKYMSYKRISFVQVGILEVFKNQFKQSCLEEYLLNRKHSFHNHWPNFTQICGDIADQHRIFYSEDDMPLGAYFLKKLTTIDKKCSECGRPNYMHIDVFYSTDQYVKVWLEAVLFQAELSEEQIENVENQIEMVFEDLTKKEEKRKLKCYIECQSCQEIISQKISLSQEHLEYSMLIFLNHFFKGSTYSEIRHPPKPASHFLHECRHLKKVRVMQMGDRVLKVFIGKYTISRPFVMAESTQNLYLQRKSEQYRSSIGFLSHSKIERITMFLLDEVRCLAESSKNAKFDKMIKDPRASFLRARSSIITTPEMKLSQAQCMDMLVPELIDELTKITNISGNLLSSRKTPMFYHKVYFMIINLLKRLFMVITELKKSVKKRELDMKYQMKDFEDGIVLEQIDSNSFDADDMTSIASEKGSEYGEDTYSCFCSSSYYDDTYKVDEEHDEWFQPIEENHVFSKSDRKTESHLLGRDGKANQEQLANTFKQISSCLKVNNAIVQFTPCYAHKHQTLLGSALNSQQHRQSLNSSIFLPEITVQFHRFLRLGMMDHEEMRRIFQALEIHERMFDISQTAKATAPLIDVVILYPNEFEILRRKKNIPLPLFIESLIGAEKWLASGGKSGCSFMRSFNELLVVKKVQAKEFQTFRKFLPEYFNHIHQGSLLAPIYGAFIISSSSSISYYIVMANLFFGMKKCHRYDLKGSITRRFSKPPTTPLDINFLIDRNSQPIFCKENVLNNLNSTLLYLSQKNIIDYSIILAIEVEEDSQYYLDGNRFTLGVIDYLREFGSVEKIQNLWKGADCTVIEPPKYMERMKQNVSKYFTQIPI